MPPILEGVAESESSPNMALAAHLTRTIDNELLPLMRRTSSGATLWFKELEATDIKEYMLPVISSLHWTDNTGKPVSQKLKTHSKARVEKILTAEDEFCEKRQTCEWISLSTGGRVPKATTPLITSLVEAATISAAMTLRTIVEGVGTTIRRVGPK